MVEYDIKTIVIICLCIFLAIVCFILGYVSQELEITKSECGVQYEKISNNN